MILKRKAGCIKAITDANRSGGIVNTYKQREVSCGIRRRAIKRNKCTGYKIRVT
jgi:hypothetical protein